MSEKEFERWLAELGPKDVERDFSPELKRFRGQIEGAEAKLNQHLNYLRLIGSRKVVLPDDLYFAKARRSIAGRVKVRPVSVAARIRALLYPEPMRVAVRKSVAAVATVRPVPGIAGLALVTLLLMVAVLLFYPGTSNGPYAGVERYLSLQQRFSAEVDLIPEGNLLRQFEDGQIDMLLRSAAILSSPSSLSRSWSFAMGRK